MADPVNHFLGGWLDNEEELRQLHADLVEDERQRARQATQRASLNAQLLRAADEAAEKAAAEQARELAVEQNARLMELAEEQGAPVELKAEERPAARLGDLFGWLKKAAPR